MPGTRRCAVRSRGMPGMPARPGRRAPSWPGRRRPQQHATAGEDPGFQGHRAGPGACRDPRQVPGSDRKVTTRPLAAALDTLVRLTAGHDLGSAGSKPTQPEHSASDAQTTQPRARSRQSARSSRRRPPGSQPLRVGRSEIVRTNNNAPLSRYATARSAVVTDFRAEGPAHPRARPDHREVTAAQRRHVG